MQALYQSEQSGEAAEAVIDQFIRHRLGALPGQDGFEDGRVPEADVPLFAAIVRKAAAERRDPGRRDRRPSRRRLAACRGSTRCCAPCSRAGCAELWGGGAQPPARVVINEYLDIAHGFFGGEEPRFANGVLDAVARALRPEEFPGAERRLST